MVDEVVRDIGGMPAALVREEGDGARVVIRYGAEERVMERDAFEALPAWSGATPEAVPKI